MEIKFTKEQAAAMNAFALEVSARLKNDPVLNNGKSLSAMLVGIGHVLGFVAHSADDPTAAYNLAIGAAEHHRKELDGDDTVPNPNRVVLPSTPSGTIH